MKRSAGKLHIPVLTALFAAMTAVLTLLVKIPVLTGYVHLGDAVIFLASCLLPAPAAMVCGALGGALADILGGYTLYVIPTVIIKSLIVLPFNSRDKKIVTKRNLTALAAAALITAAGYYLADAFIIAYSQSASPADFEKILLSAVPWTSALYGLVGNLVQAAAGSAVFAAIGTALDKINVKKLLEEK